MIVKKKISSLSSYFRLNISYSNQNYLQMLKQSSFRTPLSVIGSFSNINLSLIQDKSRKNVLIVS
jgi:hypothetical protein